MPTPDCNETDDLCKVAAAISSSPARTAFSASSSCASAYFDSCPKAARLLWVKEQRIGHVRGMSAEPSTTKVGVPTAISEARTARIAPPGRPARDTVVGPRPADTSWVYDAQTLGQLRADAPRIPGGRSLQRRALVPPLRGP
jgi:hypothetical protein